MNSLPRAVLYARVSTEEQSRGYSIPTQLEAMRQYCAQRGYQVIAEYTDTHSGTEMDRPGITALIEALPHLDPDVVVLYDVDRLGREVIVQAILERELTAHGARLEYVLGGDTGTPEGELLRLIKGALAVYENRQRVERARRGKKGRVAAGYPIPTGARAPFGYRYVSDGPKRGHFEIVEEEAAVVRSIYHWLVFEGCSSYEIAQRLWQRGVSPGTENLPIYRARRKTPPGQWSPRTIVRMVKNPVYKGLFAWNKRRVETTNGRRRITPLPPDEWVVADVPAIVSEALWERAQQALEENRLRARRNTKRFYLLRGLIVCVCGRRWVGRYKTNVGVAYYRCATTESEPWRRACSARWSYRADVLEAAVWRAVIERLSETDLLRAGIEERQRQEQEQRAALERRITACTQELDAIDAKLLQLLRAELDGYPKALIDGERQRLLDLRESVLRQRAALEDQRNATWLQWEDVEQAMAALHAIVQEASVAAEPEERRRILELLRIRIDVIDRHTVRVSGIVPVSVVTLSSAQNRRNRQGEGLGFSTVLDLHSRAA